MLSYIKNAFFAYLQGLGYNVSDNANYCSEDFPRLLLRTDSARVQHGRDFTTMDHRFIVDIFSTYNGEKEILETVDNITAHLMEFMNDHSKIHYASLYSLRIIDDNESGPIRKHGVATFSFSVAQGAMINED